jgi:hypothetical protein
MFWRKKNQSAEPSSAPPPWENIDAVPQMHHATGRFRLNLIEFTSSVTGFSPLGTKLFLLGFAVAIGFVAYILFETSQIGPPLPPRAGRPAIDGFASTSYQLP